eukprot:365427-Hanusia_phi.AAC.1
MSDSESTGDEELEFDEVEMDIDQERALIDPDILELHDAIENGDVELAKEKLGKVPRNARGVDGDTVATNTHHMIQSLPHPLDDYAERGEDVNVIDQEESTPLHDACAGGADKDVENEAGETPETLAHEANVKACFT